MQRSMSGGELTPALWTRTDEQKYQAGLRTLRNAFIIRHGGAMGRPGTTFVAQTKLTTSSARVIPFIFNINTTAAFEFGDYYMRVHMNGKPVYAVNSPWNSATAYAQGQTATVSGVNYYCVQANTNNTPPNATYWYAMPGFIYEVPTPYPVGDLPLLDYVQSASVMTFANSNHPPINLYYLNNGSVFTPNLQIWFSIIPFAPSISPPTGIAGSGGITPAIPPVSPQYSYVITTVNPTTGEESIASSSIITYPASLQYPVFVTWSATAGMVYNVYRGFVSSAVGLIGASIPGNVFTDIGADPDATVTPPISGNPFISAGNYPSTVAYVQQRLTFANTANNPTTVWMSQTGRFYNFSISSPSQADDSIQFKMAAQQVNPIAHLIELNEPLIFTQAGEWLIQGDQNGVISPTTIFPQQQSYEGSAAQPRPLVVSGDALFLQAMGSIIRNLAYDFQRGKFDGSDLTIFSAHLFDGYTIVDWAYQKTPHSIVWVLRSDGALLSLTYIREQQIVAWARHDFTNGTPISITCIPENGLDVIYLVMQRTILGANAQYIERMTNPIVTPTTNILNWIGMDCATTIDGRNTYAVSMTLSGGTLWNETELLTLTASSARFGTYSTSGIQYFLYVYGTNPQIMVRFTPTVYISSTVVHGFVDRTVLPGLQNIPTSVWTLAQSSLPAGLDMLDGQAVSIFADGNVVASPNNPNYPSYTVVGGALTPSLDKPYGVIQVGLPITTDIETLDIDSPNQETISDKMKVIGKVTLHVQNTRGLFVGPENPDSNPISLGVPNTVNGLNEIAIRQNENYDQTVALQTGKIEVDIQPQWDSNGHVFIRQVDPLPMSIIGIAADGLFAFEGKY